MPINAAIPEYMREITEAAVIFYAGCKPTFTAINPTAKRSVRRLNVKAIGYYMAVGV